VSIALLHTRSLRHSIRLLKEAFGTIPIAKIQSDGSEQAERIIWGSPNPTLDCKCLLYQAPRLLVSTPSQRHIPE
jgi:hypothetical protein